MLGTRSVLDRPCTTIYRPGLITTGIDRCHDCACVRGLNLSVFEIVHILQNKMLLIVLVIGQNISSNTYKKSKTRDHYFSRD